LTTTSKLTSGRASPRTTSATEGPKRRPERGGVNGSR
jgi:hypothetical protein